MFKVKQYDLDARHIDLIAVLGAEKRSNDEYMGIGSNEVEYKKRLKWSELDQSIKDKYNKERSIQRTKSKIRRLCISQSMSYMWTLTFASKMVVDGNGDTKDAGVLDDAWALWTAFIKRCKRAGLKFDYIVTVEVQEQRLKEHKEKVYHFHFVTNKMMANTPENARDMKREHDIQTLWGHGYVFVSFRRKSQKSLVARYITKYVSKMFDESPKAANRYRCSKGMVIPCQEKFFATELEIDLYMNQLANEKNLELKKEYYPINDGDIEVLVYLLSPKMYKFKKDRGKNNANKNSD